MLTNCLLLTIWMLKLGSAQEMLANEKCNDYPDRGTCDDRSFQVKWYYDRFSHRCREFFYGGCGGNKNRFDTFQECTEECHFEPDGMEAETRCHLPHDPGTCNGDFERWTFDWRRKQCICSWWSGCGGNANRFYSFDHCMSICGKFAITHSPETSEQFRVEPARQLPQDRTRTRLYFQAAPVQTLPSGYRNLFISGRGSTNTNTDNNVDSSNNNNNDAYRTRRILVSGMAPILYTRILPPVPLRIRGGRQRTRNRTLSTKEIFRLQQLQRSSQRMSGETSQERHSDTAKQQQASNIIRTDREPSNEEGLSAEQIAHLEARKWKHYKREQARIREENYRRQLQALREQQEALNLQRYNQLYPRSRDSYSDAQQYQREHVPNTTKERSMDSSRNNMQPALRNHSQNHIVHAHIQQKPNDAKHPEVRTNQFDSETLRREHAEAEERRAEAEYAAHQADAEAQARRAQAETEARRAETEALTQRAKAEAQARPDEAETEAHRAKTEAEARRARAEAQAHRTDKEARRKQASQEQLSQAEASARAYDARQLEYYRQLQEHRRKYVEEIRRRQLLEREQQLRYREELMRSRYNLDTARALAAQRRQQILASASESRAHLHTDNTAQQQTTVQQSSEDKAKASHQQRQTGMRRPTDNASRSWIDGDGRRAYIRQRISVNHLEPTSTTTIPRETTAERRSDVEIQRAKAKARKRARFEKLKKLERMGLLPLRTPKPTTARLETTPKPVVRTLEEEFDTAVVQPSLEQSRLAVSKTQSESKEKLSTDEDVRSKVSGTQRPAVDATSRKLSPVKQAKKLNRELVKTAEKVAEEDEVTRAEVISAEEKNEPLNTGKQILSLDDYDDEEWIEEEYDVDEYGRRLPEEYESDRMSSSEQDIFMTSRDLQAEPLGGRRPTVSHIAIHPSAIISSSKVSPTNGESNIGALPSTIQETPESPNQMHRASKAMPSLSLPVAPREESYIAPSLSDSVTSEIDSTGTEAPGETLTTSEDMDFRSTDPTMVSVTIQTAELSVTNGMTIRPVHSDRVGFSVITDEESSTDTPPLWSQPSSPFPRTPQWQDSERTSNERTAIFHGSTEITDMKGNIGKKEDVGVDVEDEQINEDDYDEDEDLFFWRPEYENKRLQKTVKGEEPNGDEKADKAENAFRIKIHNKEVLAR